jgi:hypothetical protein
LEVANRWRHPRYLSSRGNLHSQKYHYARLPPIPATPLHLGCISRSHRFSPCDDLSPRYDRSWLADGHERLTQGLRKRIRLASHPGLSLGDHPGFSTRLLSIPTPAVATSWGVSGRGARKLRFVGSRRVLPAGPLAIRGAVRRALARPVSPQICWRPSAGGM